MVVNLCTTYKDLRPLTMKRLIYFLYKPNLVFHLIISTNHIRAHTHNIDFDILERRNASIICTALHNIDISYLVIYRSDTLTISYLLPFV